MRVCAVLGAPTPTGTCPGSATHPPLHSTPRTRKNLRLGPQAEGDLGAWAGFRGTVPWRKGSRARRTGRLRAEPALGSRPSLRRLFRAFRLEAQPAAGRAGHRQVTQVTEQVGDDGRQLGQAQSTPPHPGKRPGIPFPETLMPLAQSTGKASPPPPGPFQPPLSLTHQLCPTVPSCVPGARA